MFFLFDSRDRGDKDDNDVCGHWFLLFIYLFIYLSIYLKLAVAVSECCLLFFFSSLCI